MSGIIAASAVVMSITVYTEKLEAVAFFTAEYKKLSIFILGMISIFILRYVRNLFLPSNVEDFNIFKSYYGPTHLNMGNYIIGALAGLIYYKQKQDGNKFKGSFVSLKQE